MRLNLKQWTAIIVLGVCSMVTQAEDKSDVRVRYEISYKSNYMGCLVELNGQQTYIVGDKYIPKMEYYAHDISNYVDSGTNKLTLRTDNVAPTLFPNQVNNAYCDVIITATIIVNGEGRKVDIANIRTSYKKNDKGQYVVTTETSKEGHTNEKGESTSGEIVLDKVEDWDAYEDGSVIFENPWYSRTFQVNQKQPYSWVNDATPIQDNAHYQQLAQQKYQEIQDAIIKKDREQLKNLLEPALSESARDQGMSRDDYFELLELQLFDRLYNLDGGWKRAPFIKDDFEFELYGTGKLFRYIYLRGNKASPILWRKNGNITWFSPTLTFINGEVKVGAM